MKKSITSLLWVSLMQGGNYILPAITIPILVRYLGPSDYGLFNLSQTWAIYFSVIIAYGFDLSVTKEVAANENSSESLSIIYSKVFFSKIYLCLFLFLTFIVLLSTQERLREHLLVYLLMYLWTLSIVFFQGWLYLGVEEPAKVSIFNFLSRAIAFLFVFIFIFLKLSLVAIVLAYVLPQALIAYFFHIYTLNKFSIKLNYINVKKVYFFLKDSFLLFLSTIAGTVTISLSIIILGFMSSKEEVGYFSVAAKLISLLFGLVLYPFQIVFFPLIIKEIKRSYIDGLKYFYRILVVSCSIMACITCLVYLNAELIIYLFVGSEFNSSVFPLKIVCWVPLFALADTLFGFLLIAFEKRMVYTAILLGGSVSCFLLNIWLVPKFNIVGSSYSWLGAELCCFFSFLVFFSFKNTGVKSKAKL